MLIYLYILYIIKVDLVISSRFIDLLGGAKSP